MLASRNMQEIGKCPRFSIFRSKMNENIPSDMISDDIRSDISSEHTLRKREPLTESDRTADNNINKKELFRPYALPDKKPERKNITVKTETEDAKQGEQISPVGDVVYSPKSSPETVLSNSNLQASAFRPALSVPNHLGVYCQNYMQGINTDILKLPNLLRGYTGESLSSPVMMTHGSCHNLTNNMAVRTLFPATSNSLNITGRLHPQQLITPNVSTPPVKGHCIGSFNSPWMSTFRDHVYSPESSPIKTLPSGPPRYQCDGCNKSYATYGGLSKHKQFHCVTHVKKEFTCKYCDKTYSTLGALKMHIRTHTLPCKCKLCGKAFSRPWLLQGHIRTHTGEKPFRCSHCGRSFADRSNLRAHLQTHTEVKKYGCSLCSKTFSRMSLLVKHSENSCPAMVR